ncbi:MAG: DMT family transporter [Rhodoferax sp.]|nr:DMT family transporter [Rhodoferax sp.]
MPQPGNPVTDHPSPWKSYLLLATSMALVGSYVALAKPLTVMMPVLLLAWLRFAIGAVAMLGWLRRPHDEPAMDRRLMALVFVESLLGNVLFSLFMLLGVRLTSAVSAGVILAGIPAAVAVFSWIFLSERIGGRVVAAIACAALGMAFLSLSNQEQGIQYQQGISGDFNPKNAWLGNLLVFGAVLCEAAYAVIGKRLSASLSPKRISALINLWGLALCTVPGVWAALHYDFGRLQAGHWALLLFYGLAASVGTVWLWMTGLRAVPAARAGVFTVMLPVSAALIGVLFLGERLSGLQGLAFGLALLGVLLATLPAGPPESAVSPAEPR